MKVKRDKMGLLNKYNDDGTWLGYAKCTCGNKTHKVMVMRFMGIVEGITGDEDVFCADCGGWLGKNRDFGYGE